STAEQVTEGIDASNLTAIVTGGASGIGLETVRVLALRKAHVIIAARNMEAANAAKQLIFKDNETALIGYISLHFSGHFLLTNLLLEKMKNTARLTGIEGRIVNLSSIAHNYTYEHGIRFDQINDERVLRVFTFYLWKNVPQGASTTCYVALHPNLKGVTGKYYVDCNEMEPSAFARDTVLAKKLWDFSNKLVSSVAKP
ncbi:short-chain dehydrogenase tic 32, partial [Quercus suber]